MFENFSLRKLFSRQQKESPARLSFQNDTERQDREEQKAIDLAPTKQEIALAGDSLFLSLFADFDHYNPDELVAKKGFDIYERMLRDPQVKSAYNTLVNMIISRDWVFVKQSDDPIQDEIIEFFKFNINNTLVGSWLQALRTILIGKAQGFSVSEKIFAVQEIDGKDRWVLTQIKKKPYWSFSYQLDDFANIISVKQNIDGVDKQLDHRKFIIYINSPDLDPVWGESDLRSVYRPYWEKDIILRFQNIWIERLAGGFVVATPSKEATNLSPAENNDLQNILKNLTKSTGIKAPMGYEIEVVQGNDTKAFEEAIQQKNREITKAMLVPNLMGFTEQKQSGSQAQAKIQLDVFLAIIKEQADTLAEVLNEQLFSQLAFWNFGVKDFPRFEFDPLTDDQKRDAANAWVNATKEQAVVNTLDDENRTRNLLKYPLREEDQEGINPKDEDEDSDDEIEDDLSLKKKECGCGHDKNVQFQSLEKTEFSDRLDFVEIEKVFDNIESAFSQDLAKVNKKIFAEFKKRMRTIHKNLPKNKDKIQYDVIAKSFDSLPTKKLMSELNGVFQSNLRFSYKAGRKSGQDALKESVKGQSKEIQDKVKFMAYTSKPVACKDKNWTVMHFVDGITLEAAENYINSEAFMNTQDLTDDERALTHRVMVEGIKNEKSIAEIIDDLEQQIKGKFSANRWDTIARTNITNIFTQAQLATYTDPAIKDFVNGLEYSAIIDNRTTVFCQTYNGRRFKINNGIWSFITPPNHQRCRSVLIPMTILDTWNESRVVKSVQPSVGFR